MGWLIRIDFPVLALMAMLVAQAGCFSGSGSSVQIQGIVTLDGNSVQSGIIRFTPQEGANGPTVGAEIHDGRYKILSGRSNGPQTGTHQVEITVIPSVSSAQMEDLRNRPINAPAGPKDQLSPPVKFRDPSLTIDLHHGLNTYDVTLKSK